MSFAPVRPLSQNDILRNRHVPDATSQEISNAAWDLGARDRELNSIARMVALKNLNKNGEKVGADELNKRYPGLDQPFKEQMTLQAAQWINDETQERREKEAVLARASGFYKGKVLPLISGAVSAMMDPIGFGVGVALGGITKLAFASKLMKFSSAQKFGIAVVENMVANTASEAIVFRANQKELQNYTARQALTNVVAGSVLLPGVFHAGSAGMRHLSKFGPKTMDAHFRTADVAAQNGKELTEIMDPLSESMGQDIAIKSEFSDAVDTTFGDKAPKIMGGEVEVQFASKDVFNRPVDKISEATIQEAKSSFGSIIGDVKEFSAGDTPVILRATPDPESPKDIFIVRANLESGEEVAQVSFDIVEAKGFLHPDGLHVKSGFRRKGIASAMYKMVELKGKKIQPSEALNVRSDLGVSFREGRKKDIELRDSGLGISPAKDMQTAMTRIVEMSEAGEIEPEMIQKFANVAEENGVDKRYMTLLDKDELTELSTSTQSQLEANLRSNRSDFGYSKEAEELTNNRPTIKENFNQETLPDFDNRLAQAKEADLDSFQAKEIEDIETVKTQRAALDSYTKCLGITL